MPASALIRPRRSAAPYRRGNARRRSFAVLARALARGRTQSAVAPMRARRRIALRLSCRIPRRRHGRRTIRPARAGIFPPRPASRRADNAVLRATFSTSHQVVSWCSSMLSLPQFLPRLRENVVEEEHEGMVAFLARLADGGAEIELSRRRRWRGLPPAACGRRRSLRPRCGRCGRSPWASCGHIASAGRAGRKSRRR